MATSGVSTATMTAYELAAAALRRAHVLRESQTPDAALFEQCRATLSRLMKAWTMDGAGLWRDDEATLDLVSGTSAYTLASRPMRVRNVRLVQGGSERRPLAEWTRDDYDLLPNKTQAGAPVAYVVDRQRAQTRLILWPVPNSSSDDLKIGVEKVIEDVTSASEEIDAPQEWLDGVIDNLAARIADEEGVSVGQALRVDAARGYARMQGFDRGPVTFEVGR